MDSNLPVGYNQNTAWQPNTETHFHPNQFHAQPFLVPQPGAIYPTFFPVLPHHSQVNTVAQGYFEHQNHISNGGVDQVRSRKRSHETKEEVSKIKEEVSKIKDHYKKEIKKIKTDFETLLNERLNKQDELIRLQNEKISQISQRNLELENIHTDLFKKVQETCDLANKLALQMNQIQIMVPLLSLQLNDLTTNCSNQTQINQQHLESLTGFNIELSKIKNLLNSVAIKVSEHITKDSEEKDTQNSQITALIESELKLTEHYNRLIKSIKQLNRDGVIYADNVSEFNKHILSLEMQIKDLSEKIKEIRSE